MLGYICPHFSQNICTVSKETLFFLHDRSTKQRFSFQQDFVNRCQQILLWPGCLGLFLLRLVTVALCWYPLRLMEESCQVHSDCENESIYVIKVAPINLLFSTQTQISTDVSITIIFLTHRNYFQAYPQAHTKWGGQPGKLIHLP